MVSEISPTELRRRILKEHGLERYKPPGMLTPTPEPYDESEVEFRKTPLMLFIEAKFGILLKKDIYMGSISDVCSRYDWKVDRATISRWRKYIRRFLIDHPDKKEIKPFVPWGLHERY